MYNKCSRCGSSIPAGSSFCPKCGAPLYGNNSNNYNVNNGPCTPAFFANDAFAVGPAGVSRGLAAILAIVGGAFGIQYFYTRKTIAGIICLIMSLCSCGTLGMILGIVQGIYMFTISNEKFYQRYVDTDATFPLF